LKLKSITIGGYKNLKKTRIQLDNITAIVSTNNYGKSNLLEAIDFGIEFLTDNPKNRKSMMKWTKGIPINKEIANDEFIFEVELFEPSLEAEYCYVKYGYKFIWYRDDNSGQKISDEWLETRSSESVRYTSYLKRTENKYRRGKSTSAYRNINLDDYQLAIDILSSIDDIELNPVIKVIQKIHYQICSSLDLGNRFQATPIEYVDDNEDGSIHFDDEDVPKALYMLQKQFPEKYDLFCETVYSLFPEFTNISIQAYELKKNDVNVELAIATAKNGEIIPEAPLSDIKIPFKIKDEIYRLLITSTCLNQPLNMSMMSTGTKRIFWLLANVFVASCNEMSLIGVEELETSIHPKLLKSLLEVLDESLDNTSLIISSHSPYLIQYIKPERIYIGVPNNCGTAAFRRINSSRVKSLAVAARDYGLSVGEYIFELMSGNRDSSNILMSYLEDT
jgi:AAA15 family ATPase/GTPase